MSTFDEFPYIATKVVPGLVHIIPLPRDLTTNNLLELARWQVGANQLETCLILSARSAVYLTPNGAESRAAEIHSGILLGGRLQPYCALTWRAKRPPCRSQPGPGFIMGDLTKGGRQATPEQHQRLAGVRLVHRDLCGRLVNANGAICGCDA